MVVVLEADSAAGLEADHSGEVEVSEAEEAVPVGNVLSRIQSGPAGIRDVASSDMMN